MVVSTARSCLGQGHRPYVKDWLFINETADAERVTDNIEGYISFQFAVLCFNNGHYSH